MLAACGEQPLDFDLRGLGGGFSTAEAATGPLANRPRPDDRGVISYPNYQVAVARRGDTLADVAARVGADPAQLAKYNGIETDVPLRKDEIIALPSRVAEPAPGTGQPVDISSLAGSAIDRSPATPGVQTTALPSSQQASPDRQEPVRHKVERGETAYSVARLYGVPVTALAEWNGLGPDFAVRAGQFLLIPVPKQNPPMRSSVGAASAAPTPVVEPAVPLPGVGSPTPVPPSAAQPLPRDEAAIEEPEVKPEQPSEPVADVGETTKPTTTARMIVPVTGSIIRGYSKGKNEGINIKAAAGAPVKSADAGTVAAITKSAEGVPIIVVRHPDNLLTVYANVADVNVQKGDKVQRGQQIAKLRSGNDAYVHFEVRKGFDSVDPTPYIQ